MNNVGQSIWMVGRSWDGPWQWWDGFGTVLHNGGTVWNNGGTVESIEILKTPWNRIFGSEHLQISKILFPGVLRISIDSTVPPLFWTVPPLFTTVPEPSHHCYGPSQNRPTIHIDRPTLFSLSSATTIKTMWDGPLQWWDGSGTVHNNDGTVLGRF